MIIFRHVYPFIYSKKNVIVLFIASVISIIITLSPSITLRYLTLDVSFFLLFIAEFSIAFFLYTCGSLPSPIRSLVCSTGLSVK